MLINIVHANNWNLIESVAKVLYFVCVCVCVCVCVLMARINTFITVSLKSKLLEG